MVIFKLFFELNYFSFHGAKITKFATHVIDDHTEGTMSQNCYLGTSFLLLLNLEN